MRQDPAKLTFEIKARDGAARTGLVVTAHGEVRTPAFIPLATNATVRGLDGDEVAELGYDVVLGNTFHLLLSPGPERIASLGGLHRFMGWDRTIVTDSGGFQVFSLAHGGVADEIKGRRSASPPPTPSGPPAGGRPTPQRRSQDRSGGGRGDVEVSEDGVRFRSLRDGRELFLGPERSMEIQAALGSDVALAFDECTPYHADRDYTARSTERTHRWLDRCLAWHEDRGPANQAVFGIVQGGVHPDLRRSSAERVSAAAVDGVAIGGTLGRDKDDMRGVLDVTVPSLPAEAPKHLLGIGEIDDLLGGVEVGIDLFDCAVPTRLARHGVALAPEPESRFRLDLVKSRFADDQRPIADGCPCPACARHTRAYLHYLARSKELTGARLLTLHNLTYVERLMSGARTAIEAGRFETYAGAVLRGAPPWDGGA